MLEASIHFKETGFLILHQCEGRWIISSKIIPGAYKVMKNISKLVSILTVILLLGLFKVIVGAAEKDDENLIEETTKKPPDGGTYIHYLSLSLYTSEKPRD